MNSLAKKWVEELKKNPSKARNKLHSHGSFCCLGVFCHFIDGESTDLLSLGGGLSANQSARLGLRSCFGRTREDEPLKYKGVEIMNSYGLRPTCLSVLNDNFDFGHKQHAEIIEENQDILFMEEE